MQHVLKRKKHNQIEVDRVKKKKLENENGQGIDQKRDE